MRVEGLLSIEGADEAAWRALERSGSIGEASGWSPVYLVCRDGGRLLGALCLYLKTDSYGEYVFDWEWARAYGRHGLPYYPKLVAAVPFTPATGPKLLVRPGLGEAGRAAVTRALLDAAQKLGDRREVSSSHALFGGEGLEIERLTGEDLGPERADLMYRFYLDT